MIVDNKSYSVQNAYLGADNGCFASLPALSHCEYVAAIIYCYDGPDMGSIISVVVGKIDLPSNTWIWGKTLSPKLIDIVDEFDGDMLEAVELKYNPSDKNIITLHFFHQETGNSATAHFHCASGIETITID